MIEHLIVLIVMIIIVLFIPLLPYLTSGNSSVTVQRDDKMGHDYNTNPNTPYYKYRNLHVKTKALHKLYPQLKIMPEVTMDTGLLQAAHDAAICSNQLCDILMMKSTKRKK